MSNTSSAVKRKYNQKTYKRLTADLKIADFELFEQLRGDMSRAEFLKMLIKEHFPEIKTEND